MEILERRIDGSFVIVKNNLPYHVIPRLPEWEVVCVQEGVDSVAQAEKYAASLLPPEPEVPDVE